MLPVFILNGAVWNMSHKAAKPQIKTDPSRGPHTIKLTEFKKTVRISLRFYFSRLCGFA